MTSDTRRYRTGAILLAAAMLAMATPGTVTSTQEGAASPLKLREVTEHRTLVVEEAEGDQPFGMMGEDPGLRLVFGVSLPGGRRIISLEQPEDVQASDSSGRDLSEIEEDFMGETTYVELEETFSFDDEPTKQELVVHLAVTDREATTFSVEMTPQATVFTGTETYPVRIGSDWIDLDGNRFGGTQVRARLVESSFGEGRGLEVSPSGADDWIEDITIEVDGDVLESSGWMRDPQTITYMFEGDFDDDGDAAVTILVRTGVERIPLRVKLKDQALP